MEAMDHKWNRLGCACCALLLAIVPCRQVRSDEDIRANNSSCDSIVYVAMGIDETFPSETPLIQCACSSEEISSVAVGETSSNSETTGGAENDSDASIAGPLVVIRPMNRLTLANASALVTESGEKLPEPKSAVPVSHRIEQHMTALPWHRSHPSRNTYAFRHQPLYFEDPNLERCGESYGCLTDAVSAVHFAGRIPLLPYLMASNAPQDKVRALPDCPTCGSFGPDAYLPPPTLKALAVQAAATTGFVFVIP